MNKDTNIRVAEESVIGALLINNELYYKVCSYLRAEHFTDLKVQVAYETFVSMFKQKKNVDVVSLAYELQNPGITLTDMAGWTATCPNSANIETYAKQVKDDFAVRRMQSVLSSVTQELKERGKHIEEIEADAIAKMQMTFSSDFPTSSVTASQSYEAWKTHYAEGAEDPEGSRVLFGLARLDHLTHGIKPGQFVVIGARQGVGKSIVAMNIAKFMSQAKKKVLFYSLEMPEDQVMNRLLSSLSGIKYWKFEKYKLSEEEKRIVQKCSQEIATWNLHFVFKGNISLDDIKLEIMRNRDNPYDVVIVDYVQLMQGKGVKEYDRITLNSQGLKSIAMNYKTRVIGLAQISREALKFDHNAKPKAHHLKGSGSLEQDAEMVILLHRPSDQEESRNGKRIEILVEKNRNGVAPAEFTIGADYSIMQISQRETFDEEIIQNNMI